MLISDFDAMNTSCLATIVLADMTTIFGYCFVKFGEKRIAKGLLGLITLCFIAAGGLVAYRQVVIVSRREARRKIHTVPVERLSLPVTVSFKKAEGSNSVQV